MRIAIHQPNFLPWDGYFRKIASVDKFVFFDDVQFERGKTFTSRTRIIQNDNPFWLTIPVKKKSSLLNINEIEVDGSQNWIKKHLRTIYFSYKKSLYFEEVYLMLENIYSLNHELLIDYNIAFIKAISRQLNLEIEFVKSSQITESNLSADVKIINICNALGATNYISGSGKGSKRYIDEKIFSENEINLTWLSMSVNNDTEDKLSIIHHLFHNGFKL